MNNYFFTLEFLILLYADDTVILSDNEEDFQNSLNSFASYCKEWKLKINETKTKIIIFGLVRQIPSRLNLRITH